MAGIGNYVHYHRKNYDTYGINYNTTGGIGFNNAYGAAKRRLDDYLKNANSLTSSQAKELSKYYTDLFYGNLDRTVNILNDGTDEKMLSISLQELARRLINDFEPLNIKEEDISYITDSLQKETRSLISQSKNKISEPGKDKISLKMLQRYAKQLEAAFNPGKMAEAFRRGSIEGKIAFKNLQEMKTAIEGMSGEINKIIQNANSQGLQETNMIEFNSEKNLKATLENAYKILKLYRGSFAGKISGASSEILVALDALLNRDGNIFALQAIGDTIKPLSDFEKTWQGKTKNIQTLGGFDLNIQGVDGFSILAEQLASKNSNFGSWEVNSEAGTLTYTPTPGSHGGQGTIDISITPIEGTKLAEILGLNQLNVSLKNYSTLYSDQKYNGVSLVKDAPLLNILVTFLESDFVNHYLNLMGSHPFKNTEDYETATRVVQYATAVRGLLGTQKNNNVLIANVRDKKTVYVIPVGELESALNNDLSNIRSYISTKNLPPRSKIESFIEVAKQKKGNNEKAFYYNNWHGEQSDEMNAATRIAMYLTGIHAIKVSASLIPNAFSLIGQSFSAKNL